MWALDHTIVTPSRALVILLDCLMKRLGPTLRGLIRETGSALDIWLVPYMQLAGVCLSHNSQYGIFNGGPRKGCNRDNYLIGVVVTGS